MSGYVQRRRSAGWRKPDGAVACTRPGPWANPFRVGAPFDFEDAQGTVRDAEQAVALYRAWVGAQPSYAVRARAQLAGLTLMCWCAEGAPCHVQDVLLPLANPKPAVRW